MKLWHYINRNLERDLIILSLALMTILIFLQVFMRYVVGNALSWSEELVRWTFVWFIWIGISYGYQTRRHVAVTVLSKLLSERNRQFLELLLSIVMLVFFAYLAIRGNDQATNRFIIRQTSPVLFVPGTETRISLSFLYYSMPVGSALASFRLLQCIIEDVKTILHRPKASNEEC